MAEYNASISIRVHLLVMRNVCPSDVLVSSM
jgi:hypothetical protein